MSMGSQKERLDVINTHNGICDLRDLARVSRVGSVYGADPEHEHTQRRP